MKSKLILLYSGGWDSTILLTMAVHMGYDVHCLLFDYGQQHVIELEKAKAWCADLSVPYSLIKIALPIQSNLTDEKKTFTGVSEFYVPARNVIFITMAASVAESIGASKVWYGAMYDDRINLFPDCTQEWVVKMNELLAMNGSYKIQVEAPLLGMTKEFITKWGEVLQINKNKIHSGYGKE